MNRRKKAFLLLCTYIIILFSPKKDNKPSYLLNNKYEYRSTTPYGSYSNGNVYIVKKNKIKKIYTNDSNDVYIIDDRKTNDPDMQIYYSYNIDTLKEMKEVIMLILEYEKNYPSNWDRTYESMLNEWYIHNLFYKLGLIQERSESVDFNNDDETKFNNKILSLILNK